MNNMARVRSALREMGVGERTCVQSVAEKLPDVDRLKIANCLSAMSSSRYKELMKLDKIGIHRYYRILPAIDPSDDTKNDSLPKSQLSRVIDVLCDIGVGEQVQIDDIHARVSDIPRSDLATTLATVLSGERYACLAKLDEYRNGKRVYEVLPNAVEWRTRQQAKPQGSRAPRRYNASGQIRNVLRDIGIGNKACVADVAAALPDLPRGNIGATLSMMSGYSNPVIQKAEVRNNTRYYEILPALGTEHEPLEVVAPRAKKKAAKKKATAQKRAKPTTAKGPKTKAAKRRAKKARAKAVARKPETTDFRPVWKRVCEVLSGKGVGTIVSIPDILKELPDLSENMVSQGVSVLAREENGVLARLGWEGHRRQYRIESCVNWFDGPKATPRPTPETDQEDDDDYNPGDDSTMGQVHQLLAELGPGHEVTARDVWNRAQWLKPVDVSAAMAMLSYPQYGMLTKLDKIGRERPYRIEKEIFNEIRHRKRGQKHKKNYTGEGKKSNVTYIDNRQMVDERVRVQCSDILLEAADAIENGEYDRTHDLMKRAYAVLHPDKKKQAARR